MNAEILSCIFMPNRETLEAREALIEERYEDKINNIQKHLKKFYSQELTVRAILSVINLHYFQAVSVNVLQIKHS